MEPSGGFGLRHVYLVLLVALGGLMAIRYVSPSIGRLIVVVALAVGVLVIARHRSAMGRQRSPLSDDERRLLERARLDPPMQTVAMLWMVLGVAALLGVIFAVQLIAPGLTDEPVNRQPFLTAIEHTGEGEPNRLVALVVVAVSIVAGGWAAFRLSEIRRARGR